MKITIALLKKQGACAEVASLLPKGAKLEHVEHGPCTVIKTSKKDPHCVWVRMDDDGIEGTVDIRLLRWRETP